MATRLRLRMTLLIAVSTALSAVALTTSPAPAAAAEPPLNVNFQAQTTATPTGYLADFGESFDLTRGYGWEDANGSPTSMVGNGRERKVLADKRLDTLMQIQLKPGSAGITTPGRWEAVVPNGQYVVTVAVGDPSYIDSRHVVNVEGVKVVDFTPTAANKQSTVSAPVEVVDGRVTIDPTGGTNTKIDYVQIATSSGTAPSLSVKAEEDKLLLGSRLVFSTVKNQARAGHRLTLSNSGAGDLTVTDLAFSGAQGADFQLCADQASSFTVPGGGTASVCVMYRPTVDAVANGVQISRGLLTISSNDTATPTYPVSLGGVNAQNYEGSAEPSLQAIFSALGYQTNAAVSDKPQKNSISGSSEAFGDEILAPYFTRLDSSQPVSLVPVAHYSGKSSNNSTRFGWYAKGSGTYNYLYQYLGGSATGGANDGYGQNQLLLPTPTAATTFEPTGNFGIANAEGIRSDDTLNLGVQRLHNVRTYPAKDAAGQPIAGSWLIGMDIGSPIKFSSKNWDYQDYVFLLTNARPATSGNQPTGGLDNQSLTSFPGTAGGVSGSGFTSTQGALDAAKISFASNQLLVATSSDTNTVHTNALQVAVNGDSKLRVQSRLVGPFVNINAGSEQQGIYWGLDGNNYLKAEIDWWTSDNARHLTIWQQTNGVGKVVKSILLPAGANTVDLRIDVEPSPQSPYNGAPFANVYYSLNGSANFPSINGTSTPVAIPTDWVRSLTYAGLMTSHQDGGTSFTARYGSFSALRR